MKTWCLFFLAASAGVASANPSAFDGIEMIRSKFGDLPLKGIVEMTGTKGEPQPEEWWLLSYDARNPFKLHYYWADDSRATDEGADDAIYRKGAPEGFIRFDRLKINSTDAFGLADKEATRAGVDFDRIDYLLHCREFSDEPIWTLKLFNRGFYVGRLDLSGSDGGLLRSVWIEYNKNSARGGINVIDSAFPDASPRVVAEGPPTSVTPGLGDPKLTDPYPGSQPLDPGLTPTTPDRVTPSPGPSIVETEPTKPENSTPGPTTPAPSEEYPAATVVEGRPGYVRSPFKPEAGLVDVRGLDSGTPAHCPYTGKIFLVP